VIQIGFHANREFFIENAENLFMALHLLYEDLKLNKLFTNEEERLAKLVFAFGLNLNPYKKAAYLSYYLREYPHLQELYKSELQKHFKGEILARDGIEIDPVPKIFDWLEDRMKGMPNSLIPYPLIFEKSRKVCRLFEIMNSQPDSLTSHFSNLLQA